MMFLQKMVTKKKIQVRRLYLTLKRKTIVTIN